MVHAYSEDIYALGTQSGDANVFVYLWCNYKFIIFWNQTRVEQRHHFIIEPKS